ncbi:MAG: FkbM family methyltransferase [Solibacillus sp.]
MNLKIDNIPKNYNQIAIWGAGLTGLEVYRYFKEINTSVDFIIDSKVTANNKFDAPIISPAKLATLNLDEIYIFVSSNAYDNEIVSQIHALGKHSGYEIFSVCPKEIHEKTKNLLQSQPNFYQPIVNLLDDTISKKTLLKIIDYRVTLNSDLIHDIHVNNQYFQPFMKDTYDGFIDCGAYDGDTIESFVKFQNFSYKNIYAIEPDLQNVQKLKEKYPDIQTFTLAAWDKNEILNFDLNGSASGKVVDTSTTSNVQGDRLDNILLSEKVDLIKMDIEGAELKALEGCKEIIKQQQPDLAICVYHKVEDLHEIPLFIHDLNPNYTFYLRHHSRGHGETVLYAINTTN